MEYNLTEFQAGCKELNITLSQEQIQQFLRFYELLVEKNKVMNLTAIIEFDEVVQKHFLDSLSITKVMDFKKNQRLLDLGTGGGFPGIPLKIAFPQLKITLMDSLNKRIVFLQQVIEELQLKDITAIHGRAEEMARKKEYRESYDVCVSRAVANLSSLSEYCIPFVKKDGYFISYKSGEIQEEIEKGKKAIHLLGGNLEDVVKFQLPNTDMGRSFVVVKKTKNTSGKFPRKAGMPSKEPLG